MIHLNQISKQFGPQIILKKAGFQILKGTRSGLVGANGSGKTTIFRLITGRDEPDDGSIAFQSPRSRQLSIGIDFHCHGVSGEVRLKSTEIGEFSYLLWRFLIPTVLLPLSCYISFFGECPRRSQAQHVVPVTGGGIFQASDIFLYFGAQKASSYL